MKEKSDYENEAKANVPNYFAYCSTCNRKFKSHQDPQDLQGLPLQECPLCHHPMRVEPIMPEQLFEQDYEQLSIRCLV